MLGDLFSTFSFESLCPSSLTMCQSRPVVHDATCKDAHAASISASVPDSRCLYQYWPGINFDGRDRITFPSANTGLSAGDAHQPANR
jgi:hypothetical protein